MEAALKTYGFGSILNDRFNGEADVILRSEESLNSLYFLKCEFLK